MFLRVMTLSIKVTTFPQRLKLITQIIQLGRDFFLFSIVKAHLSLASYHLAALLPSYILQSDREGKQGQASSIVKQVLDGSRQAGLSQRENECSRSRFKLSLENRSESQFYAAEIVQGGRYMIILPGEEDRHKSVSSKEANRSKGRAVYLTPQSRIIAYLGSKEDGRLQRLHVDNGLLARLIVLSR